MDILFLLILIAAGFVGSGLMYLAVRKGAQKKLDYQTFAEERGWVFEQEAITTGSFVWERFRDPKDDWTLRIIFTGDGVYDGRTERRIEWHTPQGALPDGEAVLGMPLPEKAVRMMESGGELGKQVLKAGLKATLYALGKTRFNLTVHEASAGHPGGVVMASDGCEHAMDALRDNAALRQFREGHREADVPVIIRDETGLTLRRPGTAKELSELVEIIELGKALRAEI